MPKASNLINKKFGKLSAIKPTKERDSSRSIIWECVCSCDNIVVKVSAIKLKSGHTKSCGCMKEEIGSRLLKHGASKIKSKEGNAQLDYSIWKSMKTRCYNTEYPEYKNYGGRGIKVCKKWRLDFDVFASYIRSLPDCPSESILTSRSFGKRIPRSIDRIDNNKGYRPGNIKWSTAKEQANNRKSNIIVHFRGKEMTLKQACEKYSNIEYKIVWQRIFRSGWNLEKALFTQRKNNNEA